MAKLSSLAATMEQRVCLYGPPKSGKTELIGKLAQYYKLLYFSLENGHSTLLKLPIELQDNINIINIRDSRSYPIAIETMMKVIKGKPVNICSTHSKVACPICIKKPDAIIERIALEETQLDTIVVIDSITQLVASALNHITKNQPDEYKLQLDDWGSLKKLMDNFFTEIQVARYHIVCITHEEEVKFEDGRAKIVPVGGSSMGSRNTARYFDHVVYCNLVNKKHITASATDYSMGILTGSRTDVKMEANKEPSLLDIFTNYKLPNFGIQEVIAEGDSNEQRRQENLDASSNSSSSLVNTTSVDGKQMDVEADPTANMSPSERALWNLKNRSRKE